MVRMCLHYCLVKIIKSYIRYKRIFAGVWLHFYQPRQGIFCTSFQIIKRHSVYQYVLYLKSLQNISIKIVLIWLLLSLTNIRGIVISFSIQEETTIGHPDHPFQCLILVRTTFGIVYVGTRSELDRICPT